MSSLASKINDVIGGEDYSSERIAKSMKMYSLEMVDKIEAWLSDANVAVDVAALVQHGHTEGTINEFIYFKRDFGNTEFYQRVKIIRAMHRGLYPGLPEATDYSLADESVRDQCSALVKVTTAIYGHTARWSSDLKEEHIDGVGYIESINDARLTDLVMKRAKDADVIVSIIRERNTANYHTIHALLSTTSMPLVNGAL